jgi:hypothetical protein
VFGGQRVVQATESALHRRDARRGGCKLKYDAVSRLRDSQPGEAKVADIGS